MMRKHTGRRLATDFADGAETRGDAEIERALLPLRSWRRSQHFPPQPVPGSPRHSAPFAKFVVNRLSAPLRTVSAIRGQVPSRALPHLWRNLRSSAFPCASAPSAKSVAKCLPAPLRSFGGICGHPPPRALSARSAVRWSDGLGRAGRGKRGRRNGPRWRRDVGDGAVRPPAVAASCPTVKCAGAEPVHPGAAPRSRDPHRSPASGFRSRRRIASSSPVGPASRAAGAGTTRAARRSCARRRDPRSDDRRCTRRPSRVHRRLSPRCP